MPVGRLRRGDRVQHQGEFRLVLRRGRRARGTHVALVALRCPVANHPGSRLGLAVSRGAGNAPARARLRRLLRETFRSLRTAFDGRFDLVVLASTPWPEAGLAAVVAEVHALAVRLGVVRAKVQ